MLSARLEVADDVCPVRDELLGELCRANDLFVPSFVYGLAPDIRASLALFCYRRSHLHSIGLAIAASCDEDSLVWAGGALAHLYSRVRGGPLRERWCRLAPTDEGSRWRRASCVCFPMTTKWPRKLRPILYLRWIWPSAYHSSLRRSRPLDRTFLTIRSTPI
jgi:hypothetical protein